MEILLLVLRIKNIGAYIMKICMGFSESRISECILCNFKLFFVEILNDFEYQEYRSVHCANLNGFS